MTGGKGGRACICAIRPCFKLLGSTALNCHQFKLSGWFGDVRVRKTSSNTKTPPYLRLQLGFHTLLPLTRAESGLTPPPPNATPPPPPPPQRTLLSGPPHIKCNITLKGRAWELEPLGPPPFLAAEALFKAAIQASKRGRPWCGNRTAFVIFMDWQLHYSFHLGVHCVYIEKVKGWVIAVLTVRNSSCFVRCTVQL